MTKAKNEHSTPTGAPMGAVAIEAKAEELAARAGCSLPTVLALGLHLADLRRADDAFAEVADDLKDRASSTERVMAGWATGLLSDRIEALREVIASQPATSLSEAAIQVEVIANYAAGIEGNYRIEHLATMIERLALSILPIVAAAAELDVDRMAWTGAVTSMRTARFAGVGVTP